MSAPRDVAAQPERTRLAWRRTALAGTVTSLLAIRYALLHHSTVWGVVLAACVALGWVGFLLGVQRRIRRLADLRPPAMTPPWPALAGAMVLVFIVLSALILV